MTRGTVGELDTTIGIAQTPVSFLSMNAPRPCPLLSVPYPLKITAVREGFDVLAPTAERVNAIFTTYNETLGEYVRVSGIVVTSAQSGTGNIRRRYRNRLSSRHKTQKGLARGYKQMLTQRTDAHNAALVNPAISET